MTKRTLFFVRHGQTEWNAIQRMQGQANSPLTDLGLQQADQSGQFLAQFPIDKFYASPLERVQQTLRAIQKHVDLPATNDDRLMEWHCGDWSGNMYTELQGKWPEEWSAWQKDRFNIRPPGGENYPDMFVRSRAFLADLQEDPASTIAIISHGMIGRVLVAALLDLDPKTTMDIRQANDVIFRIDIEDGNATATHFVRGEGPKDGLLLYQR